MPRTATHRPTIVDVALTAGVSKSAVSLALRGDPGVSDATRRRVLEAAEEIGYRSNSWARSLARGRSGLLGVVLTDLHSAFHTDVAHGVEDAADEHGLGVLLGHGRRDARTLAARVDAMLGLGVDGLVLVTGLLDHDQLAELGRRVPTVVVGRPDAVPDEVGAVHGDDAAGTRAALEHLVALGHRRVAHLTSASSAAARARAEAFTATMRAFGLEDRAEVVVADPATARDPWATRTPAPASGTADALAALVERIRAGGPDAPTAVFAATDRHATALLGAALDAGVAVPDRLSVVGYDNTDRAAQVRPALTSVDQPRLHMGRRAVQMLDAQLRGAQPRHVVVSPGLTVRASTAPPPP
ncbi:LacI family DNA-binding transcriptional regulator [Cellulomonas oligotrophica]|uniref:Transcriptional regulator n=1 Tax=Cellulomonas oligotrophica TaxID=931536 RepID=A0A7Y9JZW7_9CELL|nr:LacI family DNA-binding transcriptional regulator [Cellulomonas oligotrophica]NYD86705.1 DNA-binding LacI/PurR family transcriptional regulator [Cellulomonas oligotrophica]GIG34580.1 transcriptional regulator [Cellulomonas oligotrophica]